jgi:hypothetical protein
LPWIAESVLIDDKAFPKTSAQAVKYFLLRTFVMSTGDDLDPDGLNGLSETGERASKVRQTRGKPAQAQAENRPNAGQVVSAGQAPANGIAPAGPKDYDTYYLKTAPAFKLTKNEAKEHLKVFGNDAQAAYKALVETSKGRVDVTDLTADPESPKEK